MIKKDSIKDAIEGMYYHFMYYQTRYIKSKNDYNRGVVAGLQLAMHRVALEISREYADEIWNELEAVIKE